MRVLRITRADLDRDPEGTMSRVHALLNERRSERRRVYRPAMSRVMPDPREPLVNVTRTIAWLAGVQGAPAVPPDWPRHYDVDQVTWNYLPAGGAPAGRD
jgi:hypothetical protein